MASKKLSLYKNLIIQRWIIERRSLDDIQKYMKDEKGVSASKSVYERLLKAWGYRKNLPNDVWKYVYLELRHRESQGKQSQVYFRGVLVPAEQVKKRTPRIFLTDKELRLTPRRRPSDHVAVISPVDSQYLEYVKSNKLPWQQFCEFFELQHSTHISFHLSCDMRRTMTPYLIRLPYFTEDVSIVSKAILGDLSAVLPLIEDDDIFSHLMLSFDDANERSTWEFIKLLIYLISNKLLPDRFYTLKPEQCPNTRIISDGILKWFQLGNNRRFCRAILSIKLSSIDTFAEAIFRSAVLNEDISMTKILLESGVDPNTSVNDGSCRYTPLQFAAEAGNIDLAKLLLQYEASTKAIYGRKRIAFAKLFPPKPSPLQLAAQAGSFELTQMLIDAGASANTPEWLGSTALQNAAVGSYYAIAQILLGVGADINACFGNKGCTLACAIEAQCEPLIDLLLEKNADVNISSINGVTPLAAAITANDYARVVDLLRRDVMLVCNKSPSPLHWSAKTGNIKIAASLLEAGVDVNQSYCIDEHYNIMSTALNTAVQERCHEMVLYLLHNGAHVNTRRSTQSALELAVISGDSKIISTLLEAGADPSARCCSLAFAVQASDKKLALTLLQKGADINRTNRNVHPPLYYAIKNEDLEMIKTLLAEGADMNITWEDFMGRPESILEAAIETSNLKIISLLVRNGADFSCTEFNPLLAASSRGRLELVQCIIKAGADVNWQASKNVAGRTALAAAAKKGHTKVVQFLLAHGANVNAPAGRHQGRTALQAAVSTSDPYLVDLLLAHGANPDDQPATEGGLSALQVAASRGNNDLIRKLSSAGANINGPPGEKHGLTAIQAAALHGHIETIKLLIKLRADVNALPGCTFGYTALQAAVLSGDLEIVSLLLNKGAHVDAGSSGGYYMVIPKNFARSWGICTALGHAVLKGRIEIVRLLLEHGADVNRENGSLLVEAARAGYLRIVALLLAWGAHVIHDGEMPSLNGAAACGKIDILKLLITHAHNNAELRGEHLLEACRLARQYGHTGAAKFLECHQVFIGSYDPNGSSLETGGFIGQKMLQ